ncbi:MAG: S49 family peptidase [Pseudomonadota bacterium]
MNKTAVGLYYMFGNITEEMAIHFALTLRKIPDLEQRVGSLLLILSSNGGSLGASQSIAESLTVLSDELSIPSVCFVCDKALSASFLIACVADHTTCTPGAVLGNVGAIFRAIDASEFLCRLGLEYQGFASGELKDCLFPASRKGELELSHLSEIARQNCRLFLAEIAKRRDFSETTLALLESGSLLNGQSALKAGLVDRTGGFLTALARAIELSGANEADIVPLNKPTQQERDPRMLDQGVALFDSIRNG